MTDGTIILVSKVLTGKDSRMKPIYEETTSEVFAIFEDVSRSEYFSASQLGMEPEELVVINPVEYNGEKSAIVNGRRLSIYRTYKRSADEMELYLHQGLGLNGGTV